MITPENLAFALEQHWAADAECWRVMEEFSLTGSDIEMAANLHSTFLSGAPPRCLVPADCLAVIEARLLDGAVSPTLFAEAQAAVLSRMLEELPAFLQQRTELPLAEETSHSEARRADRAEGAPAATGGVAAMVGHGRATDEARASLSYAEAPTKHFAGLRVSLAYKLLNR